MYVCLFEGMYVGMYVFIYVYMYIHIIILIYTYIHIYRKRRKGIGEVCVRDGALGVRDVPCDSLQG